MSVSDAPTPAAQAASSERRPLTVLFADIAGSTAIAERLDPEDWTEIVGEAFGCMNSTVERYGGTVARLMGDGVLALFGAPVAHEDDPERAARCALDMVRSIDELGSAQRATGSEGLRVRVGINTGPVVVGLVGTEKAHEYTAMGDTVNVAARMQSAARPGSVLVTSATYRFIAPLVEASDVGMLELKGKSDAVHAFEVTGIKRDAIATRGLAGVRAPLVGRDAELDRLGNVFRVVQAGQGRVTAVLGDPGLGKSRLLAELHERIDHEVGSVQWIEGRCLSYGETMPYHLVSDLVRSVIGVNSAADGPQVAVALEKSLRDLLGDEWPETYAHLGHLLSVKLTPDMAARLPLLSIEALKRNAASLVSVLRGVAARGPAVVVCDDVHWADSASVDTLLQALPSVRSLPVLLILSMRVERASTGWRLVSESRDMFGDALTEVRLEPLSMDDSRLLVANLLRIESLPSETRESVLAKAEGNPFFVEEVIRMLIDSGAIVREGDRWIANEGATRIAIPDTIHGLLLARIDRLPQETKRTLRVASVIGRQFGVSLLERLVEARTS
ncbi:MAG TPA: adenylate/guanylate cyclase domain-containing protein [Candidatus Dormibacteraeota bacterium]|nr:adenylate/guanylate cyclase domain-containing protein [Candidatus Dormibacteraeota bacterium]HEV2477812.1 adenylate/guanylate cyclase domain-containing protein [Candidatus Dormibacteraeota bacterium]